MSLIKCPECGREISNQADICVGCGYPIKKYSNSVDRSDLVGKLYMDSDYEQRDYANISQPIRTEQQQPKKKTHVGGALIALIIVVAIAITLNKSSGTANNVNDIKASVKDFDYELVDNTVQIHTYKGKKKVLYICSQYEIDGNIYITDLSEFSNAFKHKTQFIILEEGIKDISVAAFNCSDIKAVYFPETMNVVYDRTIDYLHPDDNEKIRIYYGGSEDEWNEIFTIHERQTVKEAWNSSDEYESKGVAVGAALAYKLNDYMGVYSDNEADYEYIYDVTKEQLEDIIKSFK